MVYKQNCLLVCVCLYSAEIDMSKELSDDELGILDWVLTGFKTQLKDKDANLDLERVRRDKLPIKKESVVKGLRRIGEHHYSNILCRKGGKNSSTIIIAVSSAVSLSDWCNNY